MTPLSEQRNFNLPAPVQAIMNMIKAAGYESYAVGGCVRDFLLGAEPSDYDLATSASPDEMLEIFKKLHVIKTGLKHGTLTVIYDGMSVEITTYRIDGAYLDNRRPDSVTFSRSLTDDLSRRDFTICAMAYSPEQGLIDPFGGINDVKNRIIRSVGDPTKRFEEDGLRIVRGMRFASVLGFTVEPITSKAMLSNSHLLGNIANERIQTELVKLLLGNNCESVLQDFRNVVMQVIPEIAPTFDFNQRSPHHIYDVYTHTVKAVSSAIQSKNVRLALLFHDIAKPDTFTLDENGRGHFYTHPQKSAKIAETIMKRLCFDSKTITRIYDLVLYHDTDILPKENVVKRWLNKLGEEALRELTEVKVADCNACNKINDEGRSLRVMQVRSTIDDIISRQACFDMKNMAINGNDIINLGIEGKAIGIILNALLEAVFDGKVENEHSALLEYTKNTLV